MTPAETAAFNAGIRHAADMALIAALTVEARHGIPAIRARAAVAALQGLAEGLKLSVKNETVSYFPETAESTASIGLYLPLATASRETAAAQGFTGDACTSCGAFQMRRVGTCLTRQACGSTTGCS